MSESEERGRPLCPPGCVPADWSEWQFKSRVRLWEAVALACDIEPSKLACEQIRPRSVELMCPEKYAKILRIALANMSKSGPLFDLTVNDPELLPKYREVGLVQFGAWAMSLGWALPEEFPSSEPMAARPGTGDVIDSPRRKREQDVLLRQIGLMALLLSDHWRSHRKDDGQPNANNIVSDLLKKLEKFPEKPRAGLGDSTMRERIAEGIRLLGQQRE